MTLAELKNTTAGEGRKILVIGQNVWGTGANGNEAHKHASRPRQWLCFDVHAKVYVDQMGNMRIDAEDNPGNLPADDIFKKLGEHIPARKAR